VVEANEPLRHLIATMRLWPDPEAPDALRVEIEGDLSWLPWEGTSRDRPPARGSPMRAPPFPASG
jgi:hypothetical protein